VDWIHLAQDGNTVVYVRVLLNSGNFLSGVATVGVLRSSRYVLGAHDSAYELDPSVCLLLLVGLKQGCENETTIRRSPTEP
jgi:hypothetical protein